MSNIAERLAGLMLSQGQILNISYVGDACTYHTLYKEHYYLVLYYKGELRAIFGESTILWSAHT